jgi:hypothetical protein
MDVLKAVALLLAGLVFFVGVFTLFAAWFAPKLLASPFMRRMTTGPRLDPSRANRTLMAVWSILLGVYFSLSVTGHTLAGLIVFAVWLPIGVVVIRRLLASGRTA